MFVQLICRNRDQQEMNALYEVLGELCRREGVQIEDRGENVEILVCPQGKITVREEGKNMILSANTRHGGPGFHAFVVELFQDLEEELEGDYELRDDLEYDKDEDFHRILHAYENELDYVRDLILNEPGFKNRNYLFDETFYLPKNKEGRVLTTTGDMDEKEFRNKSLDDLMDNFYVWNDWDRDARFYRNSALTLLAKECYGPYSKMNDQSEKIAEEICDDLEIAFEKDPALPLPVNAYNELIKLLDRKNKLEGAVQMAKEPVQYRSQEVYHLFEDARVVAPGTAERSYDPAAQSVFLMAPYTEEGEWSWLIQASKQKEIVPNLAEVEAQEAEKTELGGHIHMDSYVEDGIYTLDAVLVQEDEHLYFHCVARSDNEIDLIKSCLLQSGFIRN